MDGSALPPAQQVTRSRWLMAAILLGAGGSLVAIAAFGKGTYKVGPLLVEMSARPSISGTTELVVQPIGGGLSLGKTKTETHAGFVALKGTVVGVVGGEAVIPVAVTAAKDPLTLASTIRDEGKTAFRKFGIKLGLLTLAGGSAGGLAIALVGLKTRRILQGMLAGVVLTGIVGLIAWQTYDIQSFSRTSFKPSGAQGGPLGR